MVAQGRTVASTPWPAPMPQSAPRLPIVDVLRGFAVAQMIVFHFIYDLNYFGWVKLSMLTDQPWIGWRTAIVTQFLLLVGVGLVLRASFKPGTRDFWRRWVEIAAAAVLVSLGSSLVFGPRFIWFGILHFVAAALVLARPLVRLGPWNLADRRRRSRIRAAVRESAVQSDTRQRDRTRHREAEDRGLRAAAAVVWRRAESAWRSARCGSAAAGRCRRRCSG